MCGSTTAGPGAIPTAFANTPRNWSRSLPTLILANATPSVAALQQTTRTLPVVFVNVADPVGAGFVASLARPGRNVTGFLLFEYGISAKWLELLKEIAPV